MFLEQEKEKMFLDLNGVLVKFWKEQGRPDKEIKIELLERMLNWYKKMGYVTLDKQSKEPVSEDLEKAANEIAYNMMPVVMITNCEDGHPDYDAWGALREKFIEGFKAGAEWQAERLLKGSPMPEDTVIFQKGIEEGKRLMMEEAVKASVNYYENIPGGSYVEIVADIPNPTGIRYKDKVKIVIVPIKEDKE